MKVLLFKKTTDTDLTEGLQVAYNDLNGIPTLTGTIEKIQVISDGSKIYIVDGIAYSANELKLITS